MHAPVGHWPLENDHRNISSNDLSSVARGIRYEERDGHRAAIFCGSESSLEVADHPALRTGSGDFSLSLWLHSDDRDVIGDLISKFDPKTRNGFQLVVSTQTGTTVTTQPNYRQIQFGIDDAYVEDAWQDCGRPGNAVKIASLVVRNDQLFASTSEFEAEETGHVWRYEGEKRWTDLGAPPMGCNSVESLAFFDGDLFAASGRYNFQGSLMGLPKNTRFGGTVYRITGDGQWIDCGHPGLEGSAPDNPSVKPGPSGQADETNCLTVFRGNLYATSHRRSGLFRYEGGKNWKLIGPDLRIMSLTIHEGELYVLANGANGGMYRYEGGSDWTWCGDPPRSTQTYCALTYQGKLLVGTWPECEIVRYDGGTDWQVLGRIGYEREVMAASVYNGKCYFGTLPMANIFRMDEAGFTFFGNIDNDPDYCLRRAWSMAIYRGTLYAGSLPQGRVMSRKTGAVVTYDKALTPGWKHLVAVRKGSTLSLYLDGELVGSNPIPATFDLNANTPLQIGGASIGHALYGALRDVRLYNHAIVP